MNQDRFLRTMQAVDDDLLEEAMRPVPGTGCVRRRTRRRMRPPPKPTLR